MSAATTTSAAAAAAAAAAASFVVHRVRCALHVPPFFLSHDRIYAAIHMRLNACIMRYRMRHCTRRGEAAATLCVRRCLLRVCVCVCGRRCCVGVSGSGRCGGCFAAFVWIHTERNLRVTRY